MPALIGLTGEYSGRTFILDGEEFTIGRSDDNDMPLDDSLVSGMHCSIQNQSGIWQFVDHESTNGSYLNGNEVSEILLKDQDVITLGSTKFRFVVDPTSSELIESPPEVVQHPAGSNVTAEATSSRDDFEDYLNPEGGGEEIDFEAWLSTPSKNNTLLAMLSVSLLFIVMLLFFTQVT